MKILVVSGVLGAGKTTFIQTLAQKTKKEFVIFENDLAGNNVDKNRLETQADLEVWEMTKGCICCEAKGDFKSSILTISNALDPDYLVIEPTGMGLLGNVIAELKEIEYERIKILSPLTIVDGLHFRESNKQFPTLFFNQVKTAKSLVVSKTETLDDSEKDEIIQYLKTINPEAEIYAQNYQTLDSSWFESYLLKYLDGSVEKVEEEILPDTFTIEGCKVTSPERLWLFLEDLCKGAYGNIVRAKGAIEVGNFKIRFDSVNYEYLMTQALDSEQSLAVFIGFNIDKHKIRKVLFGESEQIKIRRQRPSKTMSAKIKR